MNEIHCVRSVDDDGLFGSGMMDVDEKEVSW